ncbi:hypothetical protein [Magnetospirillum sp. SS-4]|uniref:hypothetical protein n=1 Tax=Magnetospirillum sp. SS-4 TaxID=2681465 RepID=UPI001383C4D4|nr:hypothetical protein [Magnetospirillum sp. SS-4]CAA7625187.1 conserved membrane hypothetical protein [Magnetospirillum sp. SS-4]
MSVPPRPGPIAVISTLAMAGVILGAIGGSVLRLDAARDAAAMALLLFVALEIRRIPIGGLRMLLPAMAAAVAALLWLPEPLTVLRRGLAEAAFITGLFTSLGMLRDAATSSPLVQSCGEQMVRQPPGRRYAVLSLGSHVISLALNFGVLPLLGMMVVKGNTLEAAGGDPTVLSIRKQRMLSAILRGFAMMTVWSPLAVSFAVTQGVIPGLPWWRLLQIQLALAVLLMVLGWIMDRLAFPPRARILVGGDGGVDWRPVLRLTLLVIAVVTAAVGIAEILSVRMVIGAMIVVPVAALLWQVAQQGGGDPRTALRAAGGFAGRLAVSLPGFRHEVAILGGAMFLGTVVSAFVSPEAAARMIAWLPLPPVLVAVLLAWSVMLLAQLGISQIVTVTVLGSALGNMGGIGLHPLVLASGLMGAWALSACSTPVGAAIMSVARMAEVPVRTVARQWNGPFVVAGALLLGLWMLGLAMVLDS